ncbi:U-box domain-containing protein 44-like [Macadamia integrifolia]|uniref:U-box domain-containing protein 44-like n=1 Tax=Macadamia integrifolia TaxID=60698 RepID=UPI001C4FF8C8|nr:U-box domain-containing protein 44-like [Macadamia integrifolia]
MDLGVALLQELCNKVANRVRELITETKDVMVEEASFQKFSRYISELNVFLQALQARGIIEARTNSESTRAALETLDSLLKKACTIIRSYKTGSRLRLFLKAQTLLKQMQDLAQEIADTISLLELANQNVALNLNSKTDQIINNLRSMELRSTAATEAIVSEIEKSTTQNGRSQAHATQLLEKIADATGVTANASLVRNELALLKQEKEEMEAQKKQAEALQLSQLIQLLYSTEIIGNRSLQEVESAASTFQQYQMESFTCPLSLELMTDPVAILCGHSFERKAILEHFRRAGAGESTICPTCKEELPSQELTPNLSLRNSIEEWKQREMDSKYEYAVSGITSDDDSRLNNALNDMQVLMEMPRYRNRSAEEGIIPKMVQVLKDRSRPINTKAALKCLYHLSDCSEDNKDVMVDAGAIRYIVKQFYRGEAEPEAVAILHKLSLKEAHAEQIGKTKDCIPFLVSLLQKENPDVSQKAQDLLQILSQNIYFVIKMAEAGYFPPFVVRFNQGSSEARAAMAAALIKMKLDDNTTKHFEDGQFTHKLIEMFSSSSPACKSACLQCIKKLLAYPKMAKHFLTHTYTIPHLLGVITFVGSESHWKQEATEILTSLVEASNLSDFHTCPGLQELQSPHNISLFWQLTSASDPGRTQVQFLHLLVALCHKSKTAQDLIRSNDNAIAGLFSCLTCDHHEVRHEVLKLIYCVSKDHPDGVPLPPSLTRKEYAINTLVAMLTSSPDIEERSNAARIIGLLPADDDVVDETLGKSEALKAIHEVISSTDDDHNSSRWLNLPVEPKPRESLDSLLENALAALLRYTQPTKPELQRQVSKLELYPSLVRVLSRGSSLAKQRTAIALAHLSQSTTVLLTEAPVTATGANNFISLLRLTRVIPNMSLCCPASVQSLCPVHGSACSSRHTFCLVKADAVGPLVQALSDTDSGVADAALMALNTLLTDNNTVSHAATAIADNHGLEAILEVLEKGSPSAQDRALDLFQSILKHTQTTNPQLQRSETILIRLLSDNALKKKAALVLRQMNIIPEQSSYF